MHDSKHGMAVCVFEGKNTRWLLGRSRPSAPAGATERAVSSPLAASTPSENEVVAPRVFGGRVVGLPVCHHVPAKAVAGSVRTALRTPARLARTPTTTAITGKAAKAPIV